MVITGLILFVRSWLFGGSVLVSVAARSMRPPFRRRDGGSFLQRSGRFLDWLRQMVHPDLERGGCLDAKEGPWQSFIFIISTHATRGKSTVLLQAGA